MSQDRELVFVYNTDGTPQGLLMDFLHRVRSPETYPCKLCDVTYGRVLKRQEWKEFLESLAIPSSFHLRNMFRRRYPPQGDGPFPAVFLRQGDRLETLISAEEMNRVADLAELKELVGKKVAGLGPPGSSQG